ncbi:hypothetical protein HYALB_00005535, partial [Hymenoscyphus albidus]
MALGANTVIKVGDENGAIKFSPDSVSIPVGGVAEFHFYPQVHSVVQGSFENPCQPLSNTSFYSGPFFTTSPQGNETTFSLSIRDEQPVYYYCGAPGHCGGGMDGIINPPTDSSRNVQAYISASTGKTTTSTSGVRGGTLGPASSASNSSTSSTPTTGGAIPTGNAPAATSSKAAGVVVESLGWGFTSLAAMLVRALTV